MARVKYSSLTVTQKKEYQAKRVRRLISRRKLEGYDVTDLERRVESILSKSPRSTHVKALEALTPSKVLQNIYAPDIETGELVKASSTRAKSYRRQIAEENRRSRQIRDEFYNRTDLLQGISTEEEYHPINYIDTIREKLLSQLNQVPEIAYQRGKKGWFPVQTAPLKDAIIQAFDNKINDAEMSGTLPQLEQYYRDHSAEISLNIGYIVQASDYGEIETALLSMTEVLLQGTRTEVSTAISELVEKYY